MSEAVRQSFESLAIEQLNQKLLEYALYNAPSEEVAFRVASLSAQYVQDIEAEILLDDLLDATASIPGQAISSLSEIYVTRGDELSLHQAFEVAKHLGGQPDLQINSKSEMLLSIVRKTKDIDLQLEIIPTLRSSLDDAANVLADDEKSIERAILLEQEFEYGLLTNNVEKIIWAAEYLPKNRSSFIMTELSSRALAESKLSPEMKRALVDVLTQLQKNHQPTLWQINHLGELLSTEDFWYVANAVIGSNRKLVGYEPTTSSKTIRVNRASDIETFMLLASEAGVWQGASERMRFGIARRRLTMKERYHSANNGRSIHNEPYLYHAAKDAKELRAGITLLGNNVAGIDRLMKVQEADKTDKASRRLGTTWWNLVQTLQATNTANAPKEHVQTIQNLFELIPIGSVMKAKLGMLLYTAGQTGMLADVLYALYDQDGKLLPDVSRTARTGTVNIKLYEDVFKLLAGSR